MLQLYQGGWPLAGPGMGVKVYHSFIEGNGPVLVVLWA